MRGSTTYEKLAMKYGKDPVDLELAHLMDIWRYYQMASYFTRGLRRRHFNNGNISNASIERLKWVSEYGIHQIPDYLPKELEIVIRYCYQILSLIYEAAKEQSEEYFIDKNTLTRKGRRYVSGLISALPGGEYGDVRLEPPQWLYDVTAKYL